MRKFHLQAWSRSTLELLLATGLVVQSSAQAAGMACWWNGATRCQVSSGAGNAHLCRTPSSETCRLAWDREQSLPAEVALLGGVVYEIPSDTRRPVATTFQIEGSYSERELRARVAAALEVPLRSLERRSAWFYMANAADKGGLDSNRVDGTDLCVTTGPSAGVMRLRISHCAPRGNSQVLYDASFAASDDASVVAVEDEHRGFVAVVINRRVETAASDFQKAALDGSSWFEQAP